MLRELVLPALALLALTACTSSVATTESTGAEPATETASASTGEGATVSDPDTSVSSETTTPLPDAAPAPAGNSASIAGAIRVGNRPPPAMRICAHPVAGGAPTCTASAEGAVEYRIEVAPGRYFLLGWVSGGELRLVAHASQIRCIRAPCPPDALIEIGVAAGEHKAGVDLTGGYVDIPAGWPSGPG